MVPGECPLEYFGMKLGQIGNQVKKLWGLVINHMDLNRHHQPAAEHGCNLHTPKPTRQSHEEQQNPLACFCDGPLLHPNKLKSEPQTSSRERAKRIISTTRIGYRTWHMRRARSWTQWWCSYRLDHCITQTAIQSEPHMVTSSIY